MVKIEIYDPAMCCPSGVCGPSVDPKLAKLQETLRLIQERSGGQVQVARFNLASEPRAFVDNAAVGKILQEEGPAALPLTFIDGEVVARREYLSAGEFQATLAARGVDVDLAPASARPAG
jgi:hypothetical protein